MIRDNINLSQNFSMFFYNCPICSKPNHFVRDCSKVHHIPEKSFIISKVNHSQPQVRFEQVLIRKLKRSNFRNLLSDVQNRALELQNKLNDDKNSEDSDFESRDAHSRTLDNLDLEEQKVSSFHREFGEKSPKSPKSSFVIFIIFMFTVNINSLRMKKEKRLLANFRILQC